MKNHIKSCVYNIDSDCVEVKFFNGVMMSIDCTAVENKLAGTMKQRSELDYLIYNKFAEYVKLILSGAITKNLNT